MVELWSYEPRVEGSTPSFSIFAFFYVNSDFILLKFMCHRGSFREDIYEKCILCKNADNGIEHIITIVKN